MPVASREILIHCDPQTVFAYVEDFENHVHWLNGHAAAAWRGDDPIGVGRVCLETIDDAPGGPYEGVPFEVIAHDPPREVKYRCGSFWAVREALGTVRVEPHDTGSRVTYELEVRFGGLLWLLSPLMGLLMGSDLDKSVKALKAELES